MGGSPQSLSTPQQRADTGAQGGQANQVARPQLRSGYIPGGPRRTGCRRLQPVSPPRQGPGKAWCADAAAAGGGQDL